MSESLKNFEIYFKKINIIDSEYNIKRSEVTKEFDKLLFALIKEIFDTCGHINKIHWKQYTPYFNDGDSCEFGLHDVYIEDDDDTYYEGDYNGESSVLVDEYYNVLESSTRELLQLFGDHIKVIVNRNDDYFTVLKYTTHD